MRRRPWLDIALSHMLLTLQFVDPIINPDLINDAVWSGTEEDED